MRSTAALALVVLAGCVLLQTALALPAWKDSFIVDDKCSDTHKRIIKQAYTFLNEALSNPLEVALGPEAGMADDVATAAFERATRYFGDNAQTTKVASGATNDDAYMKCFNDIRANKDKPKFFCSAAAFGDKMKALPGVKADVLDALVTAIKLDIEGASKFAAGWAPGKQIKRDAALKAKAVKAIAGAEDLAKQLVQEFETSIVFNMDSAPNLCGQMVQFAKTIPQMATVLVSTMLHETTHVICGTIDENVRVADKRVSAFTFFFAPPAVRNAPAYGMRCDLQFCKKARIEKSALKSFMKRSINNADSYAELFDKAVLSLYRKHLPTPEEVKQLRDTKKRAAPEDDTTVDPDKFLKSEDELKKLKSSLVVHSFLYWMNWVDADHKVDFKVQPCVNPEKDTTPAPAETPSEPKRKKRKMKLIEKVEEDPVQKATEDPALKADLDAMAKEEPAKDTPNPTKQDATPASPSPTAPTSPNPSALTPAAEPQKKA